MWPRSLDIDYHDELNCSTIGFNMSYYWCEDKISNYESIAKKKTQQNLKDHPTHLFHDLVATSEVEALL